MKRNFEKCVGQYPVSKTLRFELIPQGKTREYIEDNGMLSRDEERAQQYQVIKRMMDDYHKFYISKVLKGLKLENLERYYELYSIKNRTEKEEKEIEEIALKMRKMISDGATKTDEYKKLFGKEMVTQILKEIASTEEEKVAVANFEKFTTYFTGFYENRKNMYVSDEKSTSIAFRIVNQNLPKYIENINSMNKILLEEVIVDKINYLENELQDILQGKKIRDFFDIANYSYVVTNEDITLYNKIIGGFVKEDGKTKIQGINEYVNLFNQQINKSNPRPKLPKLVPLYKQILADRESEGFVVTEFNSDQEVFDEISLLINMIFTEVIDNNKLINAINNLQYGELDKIYIKTESLTEISKVLTDDWHFITGCIENEYDYNHEKKKKDEKYYEARRKELNKQKSISIQEINRIIENYSDKTVACVDYFSSVQVLLKDIKDKWLDIQQLLNGEYYSKYGLKGDKANVAKIKALLDAFKELERILKILLGTGKEAERDSVFYGEFTSIYECVNTITPLYNKVRNYLTKKPYSTEKCKLNFDNPTLLNGWDISKEIDNYCVILRKNGLYYLGIMDKKHNKVMTKENIITDENDSFEKMEYKLLPGPNKMIPKVVFAASNSELYNPPKEIVDEYEKKSHIKSNTNFSLEKCHKLIDFFKECISKNKDWEVFGFEFSDTDSYEDISQFYHEVEKQGYSVKFRNVATSYVEQLVEEGKMYLFQIYNKDYSIFSKKDSKKNLHTLYWEALFNEKNLADVVYKLNGEAEVFFRKASISEGDKNYVVHKAGEPIAKKNSKAAELGEKSLFEYDIVKNRRYTVDKFMLHVPITMNFCAEGKNNINEMIMDIIRENDDMCVIGIDRGERNLLYASVIDSNGKILEQIGLNVIQNDRGYNQDYHKLLDDREKKIDSQRRSWDDIESIKELKEGYLSQAIHIITQLVIKYNAIVVMEDLNFGFMNGRKKVNKQVYQKFEKMLIDKLNYYVDKNQAASEYGGVLKAYQLANKFESFTKLGKQSGALFYIPAWNTSKIDPTTGFVDLLHPKYENISSAIEFLHRFDAIGYNSAEDYFEFSFDYSNFTNAAAGTQEKWTICSYGTRIINFRNPEKNGEWDSKEINLTKEFRQLFDKYGVKISGNMKEDICTIEDATFLKAMIDGIKNVLQMRNSITGTDVDYMLSPVRNATGKFYCSNDGIDYLPENADANGAYNIARKGLWVMEQVRQSGDKKVRLAITNKEWLVYAQSHTVV